MYFTIKICRRLGWSFLTWKNIAAGDDGTKHVQVWKCGLIFMYIISILL